MEGVETSALNEAQLLAVQTDLGIKKNADDLAAEIARATGAEEVINNTVSENDEAVRTLVSNEVTRATDAEETLQELIAALRALVPTQAAESNQLADKEFVNSTVGTNTAYPIGTFESLEELEAYTGTLTNNDYAYVITLDEIGNRIFNRYKWDGREEVWKYEYTLNTTGFTAAQIAAINSGVTAELIEYLETFSIDSALSDTGENAIINKVVTQNIYGYLNTEAIQGTNTEAHNFIVANGNVLVRNGTTLKVTFTKDCYSATATTAPVDSAYPKISVDNGATYYPVYVNQHGTPIPIPSHQIVSRNSLANYHWWWQAYTTLEFMFVSELGDNGAWLIMGNPETVSYNSSTESYKIKADGLIEQWQSLKGDITSYVKSDYIYNNYTYNFSVVFVSVNYAIPNMLTWVASSAGTNLTKEKNYLKLIRVTSDLLVQTLYVKGY